MESWGGTFRNTVGGWFGESEPSNTRAAPDALCRSVPVGVGPGQAAAPGAGRGAEASGVQLDEGMGQLSQLVSNLKAQATWSHPSSQPNTTPHHTTPHTAHHATPRHATPHHTIPPHPAPPCLPQADAMNSEISAQTNSLDGEIDTADRQSAHMQHTSKRTQAMTR